MIVMGTGHRPDKLGGWENHESSLQLPRQVAREALEVMAPDKVVSGMAAGWDLALAAAAIDLKIHLLAAIPHEGQESRWSDYWKMVYREIRKRAQEEVVLQSEYVHGCLNDRNTWMVRHVAKNGSVLALWNGSKGGTSHCVREAQAAKVPIINLWPRYGALAKDA